jgi:hypothetical protein
MFVFEYVYVFLYVGGQGCCPQMVCKGTASLFLLNKKKALHLTTMNDNLELSQSQWA